MRKRMTGVMTGVKGQFEVNYAPSLPKKDPPVLPPNEIELATSIHTQGRRIFKPNLKLVGYNGTYVGKVYITSRSIS